MASHDYFVQYTTVADGPWIEDGDFLTEDSARQQASFMVHAGKAVSARVLYVVHYEAGPVAPRYSEGSGAS